MTVPFHYSMRLSGQLYSTGSWSIGIRFAHEQALDNYGMLTGDQVFNPAADQSKLEDWADAIRGLYNRQIVHPTMRLWLGDGGAISTIRCSRIGPDGKELAVAIVESAQLAVGNGSPKFPSQLAIAVTTLSGKPGATNRGRFYWPATAGAVSNSGRIDEGSMTGLAPAFGDFLYQVGNAGADIGNPSLVPVIVSGVRNQARRIESVRVGNRFDIQRRRADKQDEVYAVAPVAQQPQP